jgi:hypothetical protein
MTSGTCLDEPPLPPERSNIGLGNRAPSYVRTVQVTAEIADAFAPKGRPNIQLGAIEQDFRYREEATWQACGLTLSFLELSAL